MSTTALLDRPTPPARHLRAVTGPVPTVADPEPAPMRDAVQARRSIARLRKVGTRNRVKTVDTSRPPMTTLPRPR